MTIVTSKPPRKRRKPAAKPATIAVSQIVKHTPKGKSWRLAQLEPDPEADAQLAAFFARMIKPHEA